MKHFTLNEFDSPDLKGSGKYMEVEFLNKLDAARELANLPFKINSGFRTEKHNKKVGGKDTSSHLSGWAADIHCLGSVNRYRILGALLKVGFNRIGIGDSFLHVDSDPHKISGVIWTY